MKNFKLNYSCKTRNKLILILFTFMIALFTLSVFFVPIKSTNAAEFTVENFESEYFIGEIMTVPEATVDVGGKQVNAQFEVIYPNGEVHSARSFEIVQYGNYTVRYYVTVDGVLYEKYETVTANKPLYEISGVGNASYGYHPYLDVKNDDGEVIAKHGGVIVSDLNMGGSLVYNRIINLQELTTMDPIITFNITPKTIGIADFDRINVKLTDVNDPNKYLILRTIGPKWTDGDYMSYSVVGINSDFTVYKGESVYNNIAGVEEWLSFAGTPGMHGSTVKDGTRTSYPNDTLSWHLDYASQKLYIKSGSTPGRKLVCSLNATGAWDGFSTGEVKLEVYGDNYFGSTANFVIRHIYGADLEDTVMNDDVAPKITVNYGNYEEGSIPNGKVNKIYPVFSANAYDQQYGTVSVRTYVYKNYYSNNRTALNIVDGTFTPTSEGVYTICYVAKDNFDNEAIKLVDVSVTTDDKPIEAELSNKVETGKQGETITLAQITPNGGFGDLDIKTKVWFGNEEVTVKNGAFVPMKVGEYTVTYEVTDYIKQSETFSYDVEVSWNDKPLVIDNIEDELFKYYVKDHKYDLPEIEMYVFNSDGRNYQTKIANVSVDNGSIVDGKYTPASEGTVTFTCSLTENGQTTTVTATREVYTISDGTTLNMSKSFVLGDGVESGVLSYYPVYTVLKDSSIEYVNALVAEFFSIKLRPIADACDLKQINVYITDSKNPEQRIKFSLLKEVRAMLMINESGTRVDLGVAFGGEDLSLSFTASTATLITHGYETGIGSYLSGKKYQGFDSGLVYCEIEFVGVGEGGAKVRIGELCAQSLSTKFKKDTTAPNITMVGEMKVSAEINSVFTLPEIIAGDVISPTLSSFTLSVETPNGEIAKDINGLALNNVPYSIYQIKLSKYGQYNISYTVVDDAGNDASYTLAIKVLDYVAPEVKISSEHTTSAKVGDTVTVADVVYTKDNIGTVIKDQIHVFVEAPNGKIVMVENKKFVATASGTYVVHYLVRDIDSDGANNNISVGNQTHLSYAVTVD